MLPNSYNRKQNLLSLDSSSPFPFPPSDFLGKIRTLISECCFQIGNGVKTLESGAGCIKAMGGSAPGRISAGLGRQWLGQREAWRVLPSLSSPPPS